MVDGVFRSFKPFKAAGTDGKFPAPLQNGPDIQYHRVDIIYTAYVRLAHTPSRWQEVIFIPKLGKKNYLLPKYYRPISLSFILLKIWQDMRSGRVKQQIPANRLTLQAARVCHR